MTDDTQAVESPTTEAAPVESAPAPEPKAAPSKPLDAASALRAAAKKLSTEQAAPKPAPQTAEKAPAKPAEPAKPGAPARDAAGRFAPSQGETAKPGEGEKVEAAPASVEGEKAAAEPEKPPEPAKVDVRAPQSWTPAAREEWSKLPPTIREQVLKRERDFAVGIQQHAERAKYGDAVRQKISPFEQNWRARGLEPTEVIEGLARADYVLTNGTTQQRAKAIAHLIRSSLGTDDAAIQLLGREIDGGGTAPGPQQIDPAAIAKQVEARILGQLGQQRAQVAQQRAQEAVAKLAEREFFGDVQQDMADLLELAGKRGQSLTPEQAYDRAVAMNPELSRIVQQREAAKKAEEARAAQARTGAAAGSLRSQPGAAPSPGKNLSPSQALRQAAADLSGRGRV